MSKKVTLNIEPDLYHQLEQRFKDDELGLNKFVNDAIKDQLETSESVSEQEDDLKSYLQKGSSGSRTYGIKGQGW